MADTRFNELCAQAMELARWYVAPFDPTDILRQLDLGDDPHEMAAVVASNLAGKCDTNPLPDPDRRWALRNYYWSKDRMALDPEDQSCVVRHAEVLQQYKEFCRKVMAGEMTTEDREYLGEDPWEEIDFRGVSLGFFVALGVGWADAHRLERICRYNLEGFC